MSARYLLDTDVLSEPLRPHPDERVMDHLRRHEGVVATASVVWHELLYGAALLPDSRRRRAVDRFLKEVVGPAIPILPYDENAAAWHAAERARLKKLGRTPPFVDAQIASIARINGLALVTRNLAHYAMFDDLDVEKWHR